MKRVMGTKINKNNNNVVWHHGIITREGREKKNNHKSVVIWLTGLPCAGKSTIAHALEDKLFSLNCHAYVLDGDNVRHRLCSDLGFSSNDRRENIRRISEVAKLFIGAGVIIITAFISPFKEDRMNARKLIGESDFIEVFCDCNLGICEERDIKGHYKKARVGEIKEFTGISSPYEPPESPEIYLNTGDMSIKECVDVIMGYLAKQKIIHGEIV